MQNYLQSFYRFSSKKDNIDYEKTIMMILQSDIEGCGYGSDNHHSQVHAFQSRLIRLSIIIIRMSAEGH